MRKPFHFLGLIYSFPIWISLTPKTFGERPGEGKSVILNWIH